MANPWFRMYSEAVDDEKLRLLAFEDRWHFIALLCCKNNGILDDDSPLMRRKVAVKLGLDLRELDEVARRLSEVGLIDQETFQPLAWDKRQFKSDKDNTAAERQKRYRESRKSNALRNGVTNDNITRPETDTHTETDSDTDTEEETHTGEPKAPEPRECVPSAISPTVAGRCCNAMTANGIIDCNPSHPILRALIEAGAAEDEFVHAARDAVKRGNKKFNYVIGIVRKQREDAAKLVLHKGRLPNKQEALEQSNRAATEGWMPPELRGVRHAN